MQTTNKGLHKLLTSSYLTLYNHKHRLMTKKQYSTVLQKHPAHQDVYEMKFQ